MRAEASPTPGLGYRFWGLVTGQGLSQIGNNFFSLALLWYVLLATHNRSDLALVATGLALPNLVGLVSGTVADRMNRWSLMIGADTARFVIAGALAVWGWESHVPLLGLVPLVLLLQTVGSFFSPAEMAVFPSLVPLPRLAQANGINQAVTMGAQIVGLGVGGLLMTAFGAPTLMGLNAISFVISVGSIVWIRRGRPRVVPETPKTAFSQDFRDGLHLIWTHSVLKRLVPIAILINFSLAPLMSLDAAWAHDVLHVDAFYYGLMGACMMGGVVVGSLGMAQLVRRWAFAILVPMALTVMGLSVVLLSQVPIFGVTAGCLAIFGIAAGIVNTAVFTLLQQVTPMEMLGRVGGTLLALTTSALPVGMAIGAALVTRVALPWIFAGGGVLSFGGVALSFGLRQKPNDQTDPIMGTELSNMADPS